MVAYTTTYSFAKPTVGDDEDVWGGYLNGNFDTLESLLKGTTALTAINVTGNITVGGNVDGRDIAADGSKLDGIESGATADQTKSDIDALGINAATLDSLDSTQFLRSDANDSTSGILTSTSNDTSSGGITVDSPLSAYISSDRGGTGYQAGYMWRTAGSTDWYNYISSSSAELKWYTTSNVMTLTTSGSLSTTPQGTLWGSSNDGSGSGLDADLLDGNHASAFALKSGTAFTGKVIVDQELQITNGDGSQTHFNYTDGSNNYIRGNITTIDTDVDLNQNNIYDVGYLTATYLRAGDGNDGYFYSDSNGRTAFTGGQFYIQSGVPYYYNYATNQYHGGTSGDNHYFRGNTLSGDSWSLTGAGAASFASVNINGNLNAVDNIYVADVISHEGDSDTYIHFQDNTISLVTAGQGEITVNSTGVRLGDTGNGYFQPVSGNYGSIQIDGGAHTGWEGYSIGGRAVFMHDNGTQTGIYNDVDNEWLFYAAHNAGANLYYNGLTRFGTTSTGVNIEGDLNAVDNIYVGGSLIHEGDTDTFINFADNVIYIRAGNSNNFACATGYTNVDKPLYNYAVYYEDFDGLTGTSVTVNCDTAQAFSLTMTGNTTFTFNSVSSGWSIGFVLELTGNGGTVTWPTSVEWAGGTAPDAPASGETDIYVFWTRDGGTTWYGVLSVDAAA